jgi:putative oxidoreductase
MSHIPLVRGASRVFLASMFVYGGLDAVRNPAAKAPRAAAVTEPLADAAPIDTNPVDLVRINGAVQVIAGLGLASGRAPRLCATLLAGSLILTTVAGHRFWEEEDSKARAQQTIHFLKNVSMLGGLLAVVSS